MTDVVHCFRLFRMIGPDGYSNILGGRQTEQHHWLDLKFSATMDFLQCKFDPPAIKTVANLAVRDVCLLRSKFLHFPLLKSEKAIHKNLELKIVR